MRVALFTMSTFAVALMLSGCGGSLQDKILTAWTDLNSALDKVQKDDDVESQKDACKKAAKAIGDLMTEAAKGDNKDAKADEAFTKKMTEQTEAYGKHVGRIAKLKGGPELLQAIGKEMTAK